MCALFVQMDMRAGVAYGIIVDGFDGKFGTYDITVSAMQVRSNRLPIHSNLQNAAFNKQKYAAALGPTVLCHVLDKLI